VVRRIILFGPPLIFVLVCLAPLSSSGFSDAARRRFDVAVAPDGWIHLLVSRDFAKNESCSLFQFDASGKLIGASGLSFSCSRLLIDKTGRFYFLSQMETGYLYRYRLRPERDGGDENPARGRY
jgi:hypothetical protein